MRIQATLAYAGAVSSQFEPMAADGESHVRSRHSQQNTRHCNSRKYVQHMTGDRIGGTVYCGSVGDS